jgi:G3E family GTPase
MDDMDHHMHAGPPPITILTGFLGAEKTTRLNRILTGDHGLRVAVLMNDFGSINIDAELVVGIENDGDIINLANGCACCNIRDDLVAAVTQVLAHPEQPEYILLEASGVADPSGIALTFMDDDMRQRIRLDSIMWVVDAEQNFAAPEMMELKLRQVAFADMLILAKEPLSLEALRETGRRLPASVSRCKGVAHTAEEQGRRVILQVVGKRVDIAVGDAWNGREPRTRIIAIGAHEGDDGAALREVFDRCRDATPLKPNKRVPC